MKISLLTVKNFKKVREVAIAPGEKNIILIGGMNKQGKSSIIGAMSAALGGKNESPQKPIREGEKSADIKIVLDDGKLVVTRRFLASGNSSLKVESPDGKLTSPQARLDRLVGLRFLDPLKFSRLAEKEQRATLLKCVDIGIDLDALAKERKAVFDERTGVNRDVKRYKVELEANPDPGAIPEDAGADLAGKISELMEKSQKHQREASRLEELRAEAKDKKEYIERLQKQIEKATDEYEVIVERGKQQAIVLSETPDVSTELDEAQKRFKEADAIREERIKKLAQKERHDRAKELFAKSETLSEELTEQIEALDEKKKSALENAKMPVEGLEIGDEGLLYNNLPLSQASGAEQLRVSLALAASMSPELSDIWVEDGALLDESSLKLVEDFAKENDLRIWLERVGELDDDALIIEDGSIRV